MRKKKSFPVVHALENGDDSTVRGIKDVLRKETVDRIDVERVLDMLERTGSKERAESLTEELGPTSHGDHRCGGAVTRPPSPSQRTGGLPLDQNKVSLLQSGTSNAISNAQIKPNERRETRELGACHHHAVGCARLGSHYCFCF